MSNFKIPDEYLKIVADIVYDNSGIVFKDSNLSVLNSRISSKLKSNGMELRDYVNKIRIDKNELMSFIDFVTTNFTSFFRNTRHFDLLSENVLPELIEKKRNENNKTIKIWSAGCSTGEETYTIAITVYEFFEKNNIALSQWDVQIVGADISLDSLFIAKEGRYPARSVEKIDPVVKDKYFIEVNEGKQYMLNDDIKKMVKFDFHNLIYDSNVNGVDVAFCRNVLIYFDEDIQRNVLDKIHKAMKPGGHLFIGHSESLVGLKTNFKPVNMGKGIVYVRK